MGVMRYDHIQQLLDRLGLDILLRDRVFSPQSTNFTPGGYSRIYPLPKSFVDKATFAEKIKEGDILMYSEKTTEGRYYQVEYVAKKINYLFCFAHERVVATSIAAGMDRPPEGYIITKEHEAPIHDRESWLGLTQADVSRGMGASGIPAWPGRPALTPAAKTSEPIVDIEIPDNIKTLRDIAESSGVHFFKIKAEKLEGNKYVGNLICRTEEDRKKFDDFLDEYLNDPSAEGEAISAEELAISAEEVAIFDHIVSLFVKVITKSSSYYFLCYDGETRSMSIFDGDNNEISTGVPYFDKLIREARSDDHSCNVTLWQDEVDRAEQERPEIQTDSKTAEDDFKKLVAISRQNGPSERHK